MASVPTVPGLDPRLVGVKRVVASLDPAVAQGVRAGAKPAGGVGSADVEARDTVRP